MKPLILFMFAVLLLTSNLQAQTKKTKDQAAIKQLCGCFEVGFNFAETFNYSEDENYKPSKVKHEKALEWVQLVEENDNKIVMQHLLQVGNPSKPTIIKHWRQDWLFENTNFYMYNHNNRWDFEQKANSEVAGQWTQKVYQVDDSPRYEGSASWVHVDGKSYWENTTDAPLPRREITKRSDYNVTVRGNRHEITADGWIHDQDNHKVIRVVGKEDVLLAQEKGYNTYTRVDDSRCNAAQNWWKENKGMWELVRQNWEVVFDKNKSLSLHHKVDDKRLYERLFKLENTTPKRKIKKIIKSYVQN